jgi:hypothetical protein
MMDGPTFCRVVLTVVKIVATQPSTPAATPQRGHDLAGRVVSCVRVLDAVDEVVTFGPFDGGGPVLTGS